MTDEPRGWFKVYVSGMEVAGGIGPYEAIKREADRYAVQYATEGSVRVRCQRIGRKQSNESNNTETSK